MRGVRVGDKWILLWLQSAKSKVRRKEGDLVEAGVLFLKDRKVFGPLCCCSSVPTEMCSCYRSQRALCDFGQLPLSVVPVIFINRKMSFKGCIMVCHQGKCFQSFFANIFIRDLGEYNISFHPTDQEVCYL